MKIANRIPEVREQLYALRSSGRQIDFVPTMGAFHEGHVSLIRAAGARRECVVVSIFVNPLQFGSRQDLVSYPRDLDADLAVARGEGVEIVLAPTAEEMYPAEELETRVHVGRIGEALEGQFRPGHFSGVATVCTKLFNIVGPDRVYLGQKDAQQVAVLRQMVADLNQPVELVVCPTVREADGLAMSSRNRLLSQRQRLEAPVLYRALEQAAARIREGAPIGEALAQGRKLVEGRKEVRLQYLEAVDPLTFSPPRPESAEVVVVAAAFLGSVRLIDNIVVGTGTPA